MRFIIVALALMAMFSTASEIQLQEEEVGSFSLQKCEVSTFSKGTVGSGNEAALATGSMALSIGMAGAGAVLGGGVGATIATTLGSEVLKAGLGFLGAPGVPSQTAHLEDQLKKFAKCTEANFDKIENEINGLWNTLDQHDRRITGNTDEIKKGVFREYKLRAEEVMNGLRFSNIFSGFLWIHIECREAYVKSMPWSNNNKPPGCSLGELYEKRNFFAGTTADSFNDIALKVKKFVEDHSKTKYMIESELTALKNALAIRAIEFIKIFVDYYNACVESGMFMLVDYADEWIGDMKKVMAHLKNSCPSGAAKDNFKKAVDWLQELANSFWWAEKCGTENKALQGLGSPEIYKCSSGCLVKKKTLNRDELTHDGLQLGFCLGFYTWGMTGGHFGNSAAESAIAGRMHSDQTAWDHSMWKFYVGCMVGVMAHVMFDFAFGKKNGQDYLLPLVDNEI